MGINIRQKGQEGEREVAQGMNGILRSVLTAHGIPHPGKDIVQRNQNQSAVGGSDLSNTMGLAIEVKRQEQLSINTWWAQCIKAAKENNEHPVLVFRQNAKGARKCWRVITLIEMPLPFNQAGLVVRAEIDWDTFLQWWYVWASRKIAAGEMPRV